MIKKLRSIFVRLFAGRKYTYCKLTSRQADLDIIEMDRRDNGPKN